MSQNNYASAISGMLTKISYRLTIIMYNCPPILKMLRLLNSCKLYQSNNVSITTIGFLLPVNIGNGSTICFNLLLYCRNSIFLFKQCWKCTEAIEIRYRTKCSHHLYYNSQCLLGMLGGLLGMSKARVLHTQPVK